MHTPMYQITPLITEKGQHKATLPLLWTRAPEASLQQCLSLPGSHRSHSDCSATCIGCSRLHCVIYKSKLPPRDGSFTTVAAARLYFKRFNSPESLTRLAHDWNSFENVVELNSSLKRKNFYDSVLPHDSTPNPFNHYPGLLHRMGISARTHV